MFNTRRPFRNQHSDGGGGSAPVANPSSETVSLQDQPDLELAELAQQFGAAQGAPTAPSSGEPSTGRNPSAPAAVHNTDQTPPAAPALPGQTVAAPTTADPLAPNPTELEYNNMADLVLNRIWNQNVETVNIDGRDIPIAQLSEAQQATIVAESFEDVIQSYESQIAELQQGGGFNLPEPEQRLIEAFRASQGDPQKLIEALEQANPVLAVGRMDDRQLVEYNLRQQYGTGWSDEDYASEMNDMSDQAISRRAKGLRAAISSQAAQSNEDYLQHLPRQQDFNDSPELYAERQEIMQYAANFRQVEDIPLEDANINHLVSLVSDMDPQTGLSPLVARMTDPASALTAAFWLEYGPSLYRQQQQALEQAKTVYYNEGRKSLLQQYPAEPPTNGGGYSPVANLTNEQQMDKLEQMNGGISSIGGSR